MDIFEQGYESYYLGLSNPHDDTQDRRRWEEGWKQAQRDCGESVAA
jgi:ribosome modulation factor